MKIKTVILIFITAVLLVSCENNDDPLDEGSELFLISGTESEDGNYLIDLYAETDTLFEGYNKLYISVKIKESGQVVTEAGIGLKPMMHMVDKKHAAPCEDPAELAGDDKFFQGAVVFIMPSNPDEGWKLGIDLTVLDSETSAELDIPWVKYLEEPRKIKVMSEIDGTIYFVSCVEPSNPQVGINTCEFTIHRKETMMNFPAVEDLIIEIEPEMPSMEHGSPNNENPAHTENGHYLGKLNFTMTGWWRVHITLKKGDEIVCNDKYMDITF